jgi:ABC-type transport system substrate-binding protein
LFKKFSSAKWLVALHCLLLSSIALAVVLNNPYSPADATKKIYYSSFNEQPKTLDPAKSYTANEYLFTAQIYEPVLQYDYFIRPYTLVPLTAAFFPTVSYFNKNQEPVSIDSKDIAFTKYTIQIKPKIFFQPHPGFAKDKQGNYRYWNVTAEVLRRERIFQLSDFKYWSTRELLADDYIYQIKRLASPSVSSPIYGLMADHILGFSDFAKNLPKHHSRASFLDLRRYPMEGVKKLNDYSYEITLVGQFPQFLFWLAMPFFSPIPWEVDKFYSQPGMDAKNLNFDWYPVGTGPFWLRENNPNRRMLLQRNHNYRQVYFPSHGSDLDKKAGFLTQVGRTIPMIDSAVYTLEKESIPRWNKFLQGYYDGSTISNDSFDQAIKLSPNGRPMLTPRMQAKKMHLLESNDISFYYLGFNMLDPVVGGLSPRARKLRQAISIAIDYNEYINIFFNGRGNPAQGPIPPGIFGHRTGKAGINPYVYRWDGDRPVQRDIEDAKRLLTEAGYPNGIDPSTGSSLILHYDVSSTSDPDEKSRLDWMRKQFAYLGIELDVRSTQYNRFQEKLRIGNAQIFSWGWLADYPDPENFLFLLYGPNGKVKYGGENASNYANPSYDALFDAMKNRPNDAKRQELIDAMLDIVRQDAPLAWGIHTQSLTLSQAWVSLTKPNVVSLNTLKYVAIDVDKRNKLRQIWNRPVLWPLAVILLIMALGLLVLMLAYYQKDREKARRIRP